MKHHYKYVLLFLSWMMTLPLYAQLSGTSSTYSRYGLGALCDQSQSYNRSMGGVAQGLRAGNRINKQNPASYSAVDSLSFIFDAQLSLERNRMSSNGEYVNVFNGSLDYVVAQCRLAKNLGLSFGFVPFSNIAYEYGQNSSVMFDKYYNQTVTQYIEYVGKGGLHEFYVGLGWRPFKHFSIGVNGSYLWGDISNTVLQYFYVDGTLNTADFSSMQSLYNANIQSWRCDVGLQYEIPFKKDASSKLTLGATVGIGHQLSGNSKLLRFTLNADTALRVAEDPYEIPMTYSGGFAFTHKDRLTIAADFTYEQWGKCTVPQINLEKSGLAYEPMQNQLKDRMKFNIGAEFVPERYSRHYLNRINYRLGAYYYTPYQKINGADGPDELSITAGFGFPTVNNRSYVNLGLQWIRRNSNVSNAILENCYLITVGLTFNERWFMKWKIE